MLLGIGNELLADDSIGCYIAEKFKDENWFVQNCGTVPENYLGLVIRVRPELLVIVDAAHMNLKPGEIRRLRKEQACSAFISTHSLPLKEFITIASKYAKQVVLIGIQPKNISFAQPMSAEAKQAARKLMNVLKLNKLEEIERL